MLSRGAFDDKIVTGARHPRGRMDRPSVGIFAQRAQDRPNRIGITTCRLEGVDGLKIRVRGFDAIDGAPVVDVKLYYEVREPPGSPN